MGLCMRTGLVVVGSLFLVACGASAPPPAAAHPSPAVGSAHPSLAITGVTCDDAAAAAGARLAFDRAKGALERLPGVESVSIGECDVFWAGHFYQSIDPTFTVPAVVGPAHECGVRVAFRDQESLRHYADAAFVLGTFIPYGTQTEVKRARTCGVLAGAPAGAAAASK